MRYHPTLCLLLLCFTATSFANAQEAKEKAVASQATATTGKVVIPERKLVFEVSEEKMLVTLASEETESLLKNRYVTYITLRPNPLSNQEYNNVHSMMDRYIRGHKKLPSERIEFGYFYFPGTTGVSRQVGGPRVLNPVRPLTEIFSDCVKITDKANQPSDSVLSFLTEEATEHTLDTYEYIEGGIPGGGRGPDSNVAVFQILTETPEQGKEIASGLLALLDHGLSAPLQEILLAEKQKLAVEIEKQEAEKKKKMEESAAMDLKKQIDAIEKVSDANLAALKNQHRLLIIDEAGLKAEVKACDGLLIKISDTIKKGQAGGSGGFKRLEQIEAIKIEAEIELLGLTARKEEISRFLQTGKLRSELIYKKGQQDFGVARLTQDIQNQNTTLHYIDTAIHRAQPLNVEGGKIMIHPIKWQTPRTPRSRGR